MTPTDLVLARVSARYLSLAVYLLSASLTLLLGHSISCLIVPEKWQFALFALGILPAVSSIYLAQRVLFDAKLFADIAQSSLELHTLDDALVTLKCIKEPLQRTLISRVQGAMRWFFYLQISVLLQFIGWLIVFVTLRG